MYYSLCFCRFGDDEEYITSGEGSAVPPTGTGQQPAGTQGNFTFIANLFLMFSFSVFYRVTFTLNEPFENDYNNRSSQKFKDVSAGITEAIDDLFQDLPGIQSASLIKIE